MHTLLQTYDGSRDRNHTASDYLVYQSSVHRIAYRNLQGRIAALQNQGQWTAR